MDITPAAPAERLLVQSYGGGGYAPRAARPGLFALYAFNLEIVRSSESSAPLRFHVSENPQASRIAYHTFSGAAGMSISVTPKGDNASTAALMNAARAPTLPASPAPLVYGLGDDQGHRIADDHGTSVR